MRENKGVIAMKKFCWLFLSLLIVLFSSVQASDLSDWQIVNYLNHPRDSHSAITKDTCIYVLGGYWSYNTVVERAFVNPDGSLTPWTDVNSMLIDRIDFASVVWNNRIYAIGGSSLDSYGYPTGLRSVETASINADYSLSSWTIVNNLPFILNGHAAVVWNDYIYVIGGVSASAVTTFYFTEGLRSHINPDGSLSSWEILSTSLNIHREDFVAVVSNGYIYAIGGNAASAPYNANTTERAQIYPDESLGSWTIETSLLIHPSRFQHAAVVANNSLYVLGGYGIEGPFTASRRVERQPILSDGHLGIAQEINPMVARRQAFPAVCVNNRYIYALGGFDGSELSSVEMAEILPTAIRDSQWQLYE
jgi:hypothetical protein